MLLLNIILIVGLLLGIARAMLERRRQQQISVAPSCSWSRPQGQTFPNRTSHQERASQDLGEVLAYLSQIHGMPFETGEYFFVKTGLSPYCHYCVDDFIPMGCPACEWSSRHRDLINWRGGALVKLAERLKAQRSTQTLLGQEPSHKLTGPSAVQ